MLRIRFVSLALALASLPTLASAAPVWVGDFEGGDLSQWDGTLNGSVGGVDYITVAQDVVVEGSNAGRIALHDDAIWPGNGLRRVELHHGPAAGRTDEGATTWFAWSFYIPEALPEDPGTTIGYWESNDSYQQMMAFNTNGQTIRFITQRPSYEEQWVGEGLFTPGQWHRIAMRVLWSTDENTGEVEVWYDGEQVVAGVNVQTLADDNDHFTQVGLLRGNQDFDDVPVIYIDDAVEGDSIEDVHPELEPSGTDTGSTTDGPPVDTTEEGGSTSAGTDATADESTGGNSSATGATTTATTDDTNASATGATTAGTGDTTGGTAPGGDDDDASGCGCSGAPPQRGAGLAVIVLAIAAVRRRPRSASV